MRLTLILPGLLYTTTVLAGGSPPFPPNGHAQCEGSTSSPRKSQIKIIAARIRPITSCGNCVVGGCTMLYRLARNTGLNYHDNFGTVAYICSQEKQSVSCGATADALESLATQCPAEDQSFAGGQYVVPGQDGVDQAHKLYVTVGRDPNVSPVPDTICSRSFVA